VYQRVLGPEHPYTLTIRRYLASWTGEAEPAAGARGQLAGLLPICERVQGPEHPRSLAIRRDLAYWVRQALGLF
jgi:hypothetical protein